MVPWKRIQRAREIADLLNTTAEQILAEKREALAKGDEALMHQVGEGKDIMSILREFIRFYLSGRLRF